MVQPTSGGDQGILRLQPTVLIVVLNALAGGVFASRVDVRTPYLNFPPLPPPPPPLTSSSLTVA